MHARYTRLFANSHGASSGSRSAFASVTDTVTPSSPTFGERRRRARRARQAGRTRKVTRSGWRSWTCWNSPGFISSLSPASRPRSPIFWASSSSGTGLRSRPGE